MTQYELPDGFEGMETAPTNQWVNVVDELGNYGRDIHLSGKDIYRFAPVWVGWAPIVPLKRKARFVVVIGYEYGPYRVKDTTADSSLRDIVVNFMPNEDVAQSVADLLETKLNGVTT